MAEQTEAEKKKRGTKANKFQIDELVAYMVQHPGFARGAQLGYSGTRTKEEMWLEITQKLDELGGHKEPESWMVTWRDLKSKASSKLAAMRKARAATGGLPNNVKALTQQEIAIWSTMDSRYSEGMNVQDSLCDSDNSQIRLETGVTVEEVCAMDVEISMPAGEWENYSLEPVAGSSSQPYQEYEAVAVLSPASEPSSATSSITGRNTAGTKSSMRISSGAPSPALPIVNATTPSPVNFTAPSPALSASSPAISAPSPTLPPGPSPTQKSYLRKPQPKRARLVSQIVDARESFRSIAASEAENMRLFAEATSRQAEAALRQADAALLQAENERRRLDLQERLESPLLATLQELCVLVRGLNGPQSN